MPMVKNIKGDIAFNCKNIAFFFDAIQAVRIRDSENPLDVRIRFWRDGKKVCDDVELYAGQIDVIKRDWHYIRDNRLWEFRTPPRSKYMTIYWFAEEARGTEFDNHVLCLVDYRMTNAVKIRLFGNDFDRLFDACEEALMKEK